MRIAIRPLKSYGGCPWPSRQQRWVEGGIDAICSKKNEEEQ